MPTTSTLLPPSSFARQPLRYDSVTVHSPTFSSLVDADGSSESDSELLLTLLGYPESTCSSDDSSARGNRPYPYTRSKTRWRKRPNDELKYLRSQIGELEALVASLSESGPRPKLLTNSEIFRDSRAEALKKVNEESHKKKMKAALVENRKLKALVAGRFQVAKALQTALDEDMRLRARKVCWPSSTAASDELLFALLDEEKELQYAATDKVLDESGIARIYHPYFSELVLQTDKRGLCFHHNDVRVLPFPVADVVQAIRHSLAHGSSVGPAEHCRKLYMHDAFSQAVTVDNVEIPGKFPVEIKGRHLLWFVVESDRTVINWSSFNEYKGVHNIRMIKRLWFSIEPLNLQSSLGRSQGSIIRTIVRFTPVDPDMDLKHVEEMSDFIIAGYKRDSIRVVLAVRDQLAALVARG